MQTMRHCATSAEIRYARCQQARQQSAQQHSHRGSGDRLQTRAAGVVRYSNGCMLSIDLARKGRSIETSGY
jgi:hypothetical protein